MPKVCPNCGYNTLGPFVDNCPMCAEPIRNVRSLGGFPGLGGLPPVLKWVAVGVAAAAVLVAGCCGLGMWRMNNLFDEARQHAEQAQAAAEADRKARTVVVSAADLLREFAADPEAADRKYDGKYLEVAGVVDKGGRGRHDTPFVVLTGGDEKAGVKVECFFDAGGRAQEAQVRRLDPGRPVTVRGEYDGQVSNVQLRECVLAEPPQPLPAGRPPG